MMLVVIPNLLDGRQRQTKFVTVLKVPEGRDWSIVPFL